MSTPSSETQKSPESSRQVEPAESFWASSTFNMMISAGAGVCLVALGLHGKGSDPVLYTGLSIVTAAVGVGAVAQRNKK